MMTADQQINESILEEIETVIETKKVKTPEKDYITPVLLKNGE